MSDDLVHHRQLEVGDAEAGVGVRLEERPT
jgi:hypothetical protein